MGTSRSHEDGRTDAPSQRRPSGNRCRAPGVAPVAARSVKVESNPSPGLIPNGILSFRGWNGLAVAARQQTYVRQAVALTSRCSLHMGSTPSRISTPRALTRLCGIQTRLLPAVGTSGFTVGRRVLGAPISHREFWDLWKRTGAADQPGSRNGTHSLLSSIDPSVKPSF